MAIMGSASFLPASRALLPALAAAIFIGLCSPAHALFSDDEARRAILELRQRVDAQRQLIDSLSQTVEAQKALLAQQATQLEAQQVEERRRGGDEGAQTRRSLLALQQQIEALSAELARMRGGDEQLARDLADLQLRQKNAGQGLEERLQRLEPVKVTVDGREFLVAPAEQRAYEAALAIFRKGDFAAAASAFSDFLQTRPHPGYRNSALFWQGNALYGARDYNGALQAFRALLQAAPEHPRAPEAVLSIANCQLELKQVPAARRTLEDLVKAYPQSEAAATARERLPRIK